MADRERLTLYGRAECHLCEEMATQLKSLAKDLGIEVLDVDIDSDPVLANQYNDLVPVLIHGDREVARYHLNIEALRAYLAEIR